MKVELLAPAKDAECAIAAINCGADAIYIGAPRFGARAAAGNSLDDIATIVRHAHTYGAKIYITINTLLYDNELHDAEQLIWQLYHLGADALLIQDLGILRLNLPPIPLHASTQTDNRTIEKVKFLQQCGFTRVVLARETPIETIRSIHEACNIELEAFVHGALCVSYSGQCYMSEAVCQRSANRGECAQLCRLPYSLVDANGKILAKGQHLLSLKDMNRSEQLKELVASGICSLKIEGRLKDTDYVKNVTAYYHQKLEEFVPPEHRASYGHVNLAFTPNLEKSFNRGFTPYFLHGREGNMAQFDTPKSLGELIGRVTTVGHGWLSVEDATKVHNGDGLCFVDAKGELTGFRVNRNEGKRLYPATMPHIKVGDTVFRNLDYTFLRTIEKKYATRLLAIDYTITETVKGVNITAEEETGIHVQIDVPCAKTVATNADQATNYLHTQLSKLGGTCFYARKVVTHFKEPYFFPASMIADWRRTLVKLIIEQKEKRPLANHPLVIGSPVTPTETSYRDNIANEKAQSFYTQHGTTQLEPAFELRHQPDAVLMQCKYCLKYEMGWCPRQNGSIPDHRPPLFLKHKENMFQLHFDCLKCEMSITKSVQK